ncbi:MAG: BMP family ABC transporter substrate-binding protein [Candidatus Hermodarchaeota archaeon]
MKFKHKKKLLIMIILFAIISTNSSIIPSNQGSASSNQMIQNIAIILDSSEFYDSDFIDDVLNGFDQVNQTYNINYTVFRLANYTSPPIPFEKTVINRYPYKAFYTIDGYQTNHTQLATELISTEQYDMIVFMGYELRREKKEYFLPSQYNDTKFLFYDLSGEIPSHPGASLGDNVAVISFNETQAGFIAGTLAAVTISPQPQKVAMIGTYRNSRDVFDPKPDPRSGQLMLGFQSGFLRKNADVTFLISYIDYYWGSWTSYTKAKALAQDLDDQGYELIFSALQNNNTLGIIDGFTKSVVAVDSNLVQRVAKNNTKVIMAMFEAFNKSQNGFLPGVFSFDLADNVFYPNGWDDSELVNQAMGEIYTDVVINKIPIGTEIKHAENTPGFSIIAIFGLILSIPISRRLIRNKS